MNMREVADPFGAFRADIVAESLADSSDSALCLAIGLVMVSGTSAKKYLAPDAQPLRQDARHPLLAPMTPGAFYGWLPYSLAPGASGGALPYTFPSGRY